MKKIIIVGIDFSEGSDYALSYAINVANQLFANILLVWVEKEKSSSKLTDNENLDPRLQVKKQFEELIEKKRKELTNGKLMYKIRSGKVHKEIANQAKYHDAFLAIAGTHGTSGFEEFWIGSEAYKLVTYSPCPVITIRYGESADRPLQKIILPLDSTRQTRQKVPFTTSLALKFNAEIVILGLYSSVGSSMKMLVNGYIDQTAKYLKDKGVKYRIEKREASNLTNTTIEFAKEEDADLVTIMSEQETTTANLLLGPFAQQMVNHSPVPVLTLRAKNIYDYQID